MPNTGRDARISEEAVHVAVAVIVNTAQQVLVTRRAEHVHQGGLLEFPGGKVEAGETVYAALCREIREELQIDIQEAQPLIKLLHHYKDKSVLLDVWRVMTFHGEPHGAEGQPLLWQSISDLDVTQFPAANRKIISALQLPQYLLITGDFLDQQAFSRKLSHALQSGVKLVQLRCKSKCDSAMYLSLVQASMKLCELAGAVLLLNSDPDLSSELSLGLHLNSHDLFKYSSRPIPHNRLLSASCHNLNEIRQAEKIHVDFALLSPVKKTSSHPDMDGLGWSEFSNLASQTPIPVYALGGLKLDDLEDARQAGAQGVAAISALWDEQ